MVSYRKLKHVHIPGVIWSKYEINPNETVILWLNKKMISGAVDC